MAHVPRMQGQKCWLTPLTPADTETLYRWFNDPDVAIGTRAYDRYQTLVFQQKWMDNLLAGGGEHRWFGIMSAELDRMVGIVGLMEIEPRNRSCEYGIAIGDPAARGKGLAYEATRLILDYAFGVLNMNSVYLWVYEYNQKGVKLYEQLGFQHAGRRRQARLLGPHQYDSLLMDMLASEYTFYTEGLFPAKP